MRGRFLAVDLAKHVFQICFYDTETGRFSHQIIRSRTAFRECLREWREREAISAIAMESCGSSHYWGRYCRNLGYQVHLLDTWMVKQFRSRSIKNDERDAEAIAVAATRGLTPPIPVKSEVDQALGLLLADHYHIGRELRRQGLRIKDMLYEYGLVINSKVKGRIVERSVKLAASLLSGEEEGLPQLALQSLRRRYSQYLILKSKLAALEEEIKLELAGNRQAQQLMAIPGVGFKTALALISKRCWLYSLGYILQSAFRREGLLDTPEAAKKIMLWQNENPLSHFFALKLQYVVRPYTWPRKGWDCYN